MKARLGLPESLTLGLVGNAACGKDTVAEVLTEYGFVHQSASAILRKVIIDEGQTPSRELQTAKANEIRRARGEEYFVAEAVNRALAAGRGEWVVVSGLYSPSEGEYLQSVNGHLIEVTGMEEDTLHDRYLRVGTRGDGSRDDMTFDEFLESHFRENGGQAPEEANIGLLANNARFTIMHDGTRDMIIPAVETILEEVANDTARIS